MVKCTNGLNPNYNIDLQYKYHTMEIMIQQKRQQQTKIMYYTGPIYIYIYIYIYLESYPFTTGATSTGVVEVASKSTQYETMSNLHSMIKKQHIIEKYYIAIHKIHKRAFFNKNMICIKMFLFFLF